MPELKAFWRYYGGKWRAAPHYPKPRHPLIVEPFAGAAGYALRYPDRDVVLIDKYPTICEMWRYLIAVSPAEVRRIPEVDHVDDLPSWVPLAARTLVGFWLNAGTTSPRKSLSAGRKRFAAAGRKFEGWTVATRERVASQVEQIRHWQVLEGDALELDSSAIEATWFVDPPYNNKAGSHYVHSRVDYEALAAWCRSARGQVIVCENEGATWLPFQPFATIRAMNGRASREVIWTNEARV